ncbi:MAG: TnpV protein [Ruminococcus sp.]|nr:TnpV protein [Ruminococcus sp.]
MTETLPKTITENGIQYILDEETQTYLPDWEISEQKEIGKYGLMRRDYLMNNRKSIYQAMLLNGTLNSHLAEIDETASRRLSEILPKMAKEAGATEELKATDQMAWVGMMNTLKAQAEEMIISELIYS